PRLGAHGHRQHQAADAQKSGDAGARARDPHRGRLAQPARAPALPRSRGGHDRGGAPLEQVERPGDTSVADLEGHVLAARHHRHVVGDGQAIATLAHVVDGVEAVLDAGAAELTGVAAELAGVAVAHEVHRAAHPARAAGAHEAADLTLTAARLTLPGDAL